MKRRSETQRARESREQRAEAEARKLHPSATEIIFSWFGTELFLDVWQKGKGGIARYVDVVDDLEAALSAQGLSR